MKKKLLILIPVLLLALYGASVWFYTLHYAPGTSINGVNVSNKDITKANELVSATEQIITVIQKGKDGQNVEEKINLSTDCNAVVRFDTSELLKKQNPFLWFTSLFSKSNLTCDKVEGTFDQSALNAAIAKLYCLQDENKIPAENAHIVLEDGNLNIVEAVDGNVINADTVREAILAAVSECINGKGSQSVDLLDKYDRASIFSDDAGLLDQLATLKKALEKTVTLQVDSSTTVKISGSELLSLVYVKDNQLAVNEEKLDEYIAALRKKYEANTNDYINASQLKNALIAALTATEGSTIKAQWVDTTVRLVEVSISQQTLWYYENGVLKLTSPVVTGNADMGSGTPIGTFEVRRMVQGATLRGKDYTEHVDYWIGFDSTGRVYGLHDASWRSEFGGDIYLTDPSHGCVNMPTDKIAQLYKMITIGTVVKIYN
ncbi:MAG: L,D-transpeptidase family protein [Erysipelotrichaceae bacterium]|nr:L,D-transpeptidase family protein [Erysipelotrichaceae bacterium]